jgi:hypothetical protein
MQFLFVVLLIRFFIESVTEGRKPGRINKTIVRNEKIHHPAEFGLR